jgi:hypothetical protein
MISIQNVTTAEELATAVCKAVKEQKWHIFTGPINGKEIRLKVFGLWPQIFDVNGVRHGASAEFGTQKVLKTFILGALA